MRVKSIFCIVVFSVFLSNLNTVYAQELKTEDNFSSGISEDSPKYENVHSIKGDLEISSTGKATLSGSLIARTADKTKVECELMCFKNGQWEVYESWSNTVYYKVCSLYKTYYVPKGYYYKVVVTGTVWIEGTICETVSYETDTRKY